MDALPDILGLLYAAHSSFTSVRLNIRDWRRQDLAHEALTRWASQNSSRRYVVNEPASTVYEREYRLWLERPWRWRWEAETGSGVGTTVYDPARQRGGTFATAVGSLFKRNNPRQSYTDDPEIEYHGASYLMYVLDPIRVLPYVTIGDIGEPIEHAGRPVIPITCTAIERGDGPDEGLFSGADGYELLVDADRGLVLGISAHLDGEEFFRYQVTEIAYDEPLANGAFDPTRPPA